MTDTSGTDTVFLPISRELSLVDDILLNVINDSSVPLVREASHHIISSGGKRFRPALAILSAKICGYNLDTSAQVGAAIELIHTASIIHDDVLDGADLRRGVESSNVRWGNHISILVGDYCYSLAGQILAEYSSPRVIGTLTRAARETTEGEVMEVVSSNDLSMKEARYLDIIRLKTACLISASCVAGSYLAEAPERLTAALKDYGMNLGMAFQIVDDILDLTSESNRLGKRRGTDLREGKLTLPIIYALESCSPEEKTLINETLLSPSYSDAHLHTVINILDKYGCLSKAGDLARKYLEKANSAMDQFKPSIEKESLLKFADFVTRRSF